MKKGNTFGMKKKLHQKKNPGRHRREEEKELSSLLRGERIPQSRLIPDKRQKKKEARMEKETRFY